MTVFVDQSPARLPAAHDELGSKFVPGQLITPLTSYSDWGGVYAIDNGAFAGLDVTGFRRIVARQKPFRDRCKFVAVPDVVGDARRTLELFDAWTFGPELYEWPLALVLQDGQENLPIPWDRLAAVFVGGTDRWKESDAAMACCKAARGRPKPIWIHVGRVNTSSRLKKFMAVADSIDGSGISRYTHMRHDLRDMLNPGENEQSLFTDPQRSVCIPAAFGHNIKHD
jgi:hypothetical protein